MTDKEAADFLKKSTLWISVPRRNTKTVTQLLYLEAMEKAIAALEEKAKAIGADMTKEWDASCENCEHAYRGADPLKIIQDSKYLFYCSAGHAYGGAENVCSEWKRKEGEAE